MSELGPVVPDELRHLVDDQVLDAHAQLSSMTLDKIVRAMPDPVLTRGHGPAVVLEPEERDGCTIGLCLPEERSWNPATAAGALFFQQAVAPNSRVIVLANNIPGNRYYSFNKEEAEYVAKGMLFPYFDQRAKHLDMLADNDELHLTGSGLGGLTAVGILLALGSNRDIRVVNADEVPNRPRTQEELRQAMELSSDYRSRVEAVQSAKIPWLSKALKNPAFLAHYMVRLDGSAEPESVALYEGMAKVNFDMLLRTVAKQYGRDTTIKLGRMTGSHVVDAEQFERTAAALPEEKAIARFVIYGGKGRAAIDNPVVQALMYKDAVVGPSAATQM